MTFDDFKDIHKGKKPVELLTALVREMDIQGSDRASRNDSVWRRNYDERDFWEREIQAHDDRAKWLFEELKKHLPPSEPRLMSHEEVCCDDGPCLERKDSKVLWKAIYANKAGNGADYNKTWRVWTATPTDEQREAEPWQSQS